MNFFVEGITGFIGAARYTSNNLKGVFFMQSNSKIDDLIILYLTNRASADQRRELEAWLSMSEHNREVFRRIQSVWQKPSLTVPDSILREKRDAIWRAGTMQSNKTTPVRSSLWGTWSRVAAILMILIVAGWGAKDWIKDLSGTTPSMMELTSGPGMKSWHVLADGTEVWLNSESTLTYPEVFSDTLRYVELSGEAFFDVTIDAKRPFVVKAGGTITRVLGTAFNIEAHEDEENIAVSLLEGKVEVRDDDAVKLSELLPGEQLMFNRDSFYVQRYDYAQIFGWKDGILIFDGADFETFKRTLEKWYGVTISVVGTPDQHWRIRARYDNESLENVMRDVTFNKKFSYQIKDNKLIIEFKPNAMP